MIERTTYQDDIRSAHGTSVAILYGRTGEVTLKVLPISGGSYNELRVTNTVDSDVWLKLANLHMAIGELLDEWDARGSRTSPAGGNK